ncbi:MAG: glycoside hydrolase family 32 protein [Athalassotoga sp.]
MNLYKPIYHFRPEKNWINDPNGLVYYKGKYHLFYQYNPYSDHWDTMHWGHAVSEDLVHWNQLPIAIYPSNEHGEKHCFSGCCVIDDKEMPKIFYTSVGEGFRNARDGAEQWMAIGDANMIKWEKSSMNPILKSSIHRGIEIKEWRDPFLWKENGRWFMILGGQDNGKGCVLLYTSKDLFQWSFLNIIFETSRYNLIECPNMLKFNDKYVLIYSPADHAVYHIGEIDENYKFVSNLEGILDESGFEGFYAPNTLIDSRGRYVMFGWMPEVARDKFYHKDLSSWAGVMSIPRVISIDEEGDLKTEPLPELEILRYDEIDYENRAVKDKWQIGQVGRAIEFEIEVFISGDEDFSLNVLESISQEEKTMIRYDALNQEMSIDRSKSSYSAYPHKSILKDKVKIQNEKKIKIHVFVDHSTIEVFASGKCISARVYPTLEDSCNLSIENKSKSKKILNIAKLTIWKLRSIWN